MRARACVRTSWFVLLSGLSQGPLYEYYNNGMATTRRLPPQDEKWTHTKITTRPSPPKEPRDERVKFPRPMGGGGGGAGVRRPTPLDVRLAQAKGSVRLVPNEMLREPEVVDFAAPAPLPWPSRMPPPPPPKRMPSWRRGVASRGSEMSFGILDYYIRDSPPMQSPEVVDCAGDSAMGRFDFGLPAMAVLTAVDAKSGAGEDDDDGEGIDLTPLSPRPFEEEKTEPHAKKYSLFPAVRDTTPSAHRLARVINDSPSCPLRKSTETTTKTSPQLTQAPSTTPTWRPRLLSGTKLATSSPRTPTTAPTTLPSPTHQPFNPSTSTQTPTPLIPLRILSTSSTSTAPTSRSSSSSTTTTTSPGSSAQKPLLSRSRWSEETVLASPGVARVSFGSLAVVHPACFFEDDEDDDGEFGGEEGLLRGRGWGGRGCGWGLLAGCCGRGRGRR